MGAAPESLPRSANQPPAHQAALPDKGGAAWVRLLASSMQRNLLGLLLGSYTLAAFWPGPGLALRAVTLVEMPLFGERLPTTLPVLMLAFLLFNAGLAVRIVQLRDLFRRPLPLVLGLTLNLTLPVLYIIGATWLMCIWHPPEVDEVQDLLAGLALVASVPVAGSSTAWSQNADGDMPLSVGLVILSTLLAPLTGPLSLACLRPFAVGDYATALGTLSAAGGALLLVAGVVVPATTGLVSRQLLGEARAGRIKPALKSANIITLLLLNYANAAVSLPRLVHHPDWHFVSVVLLFATGLCLALFLGGWCLGRLLRVSRGRRISLMFGLGMTNNGTGLVLASLVLGEYPQVVMPIIVYNLIQHLVAGAAQRLVR
jgi:BASS family bile acid:Na+ symporter